MTRERALEIIAAYGGDSARWPADERAAVLAMRDGAVVTAIAEARALDAALDDWALGEVAATFDFAGMAAGAQERPAMVVAGAQQRPAMVVAGARQGPNRWLAGGALAASIAAVVVMMGPMKSGTAPMTATVSTNSPVQSATAKGGAAVSDAEAFASVFTPTVDEEELI